MKLKDNTVVTHIAIVLDKSGSMSNIKDETINGLTEQIQAIKGNVKENQETYVSFVTFGGDVSELFFEEPVDKLDEIDKDSYYPNGLTPMLDAVGYTINKLKESTDYKADNHRYLIVIMSDGQENDSKEYNYSTIAKMIKSLQDTERWTFTYMGPMGELDKIEKKLHIPKGNISGYEITVDGAKDATAQITRSTVSYMASKNVKTDSFYSEDTVNK